MLFHRNAHPDDPVDIVISSFPQVFFQLRDRFLGSLHFRFHIAVIQVFDPSGDTVMLSQLLHAPAEPDTLHHALDPDLDTPDRADDALTRLHGTGGRPP